MTLLKLLLFVLTITFLFSASALIWARHLQPLLVLDMEDLNGLPRHFRTSDHPVNPSVNQSGLADLHIAGGGQFSRQGLQKVLERLPVRDPVIIDLRQESHGFVSGQPVSWYGQANSANAGRSDDQIEARQAGLLRRLSRHQKVKAYTDLIKTPDYKIAKARPELLPVRAAQSEAELAASLSLRYQRFYVQDYQAPNAVQVDRFISFVRQLPAGTWLYFHCRAGVGRSTTFMAMYDMIRNARHVSFEDILVRQKALGGKDLAKLPARDSYKYKSAVARLEFLRQFYQYAQENRDDFKTVWTTWRGRHD